MTRGVWVLAAAFLAAPAAAEIELPGCDAPPEVEAAYALPAELARHCGGDRACWQEGLERTRDLAARFETSYDAHRIRVLVARGARRALGAEAVAEVVATYRDLTRRHADHPAYRHLLAQLELEDGAYEAELERIAIVARYHKGAYAEIHCPELQALAPGLRVELLKLAALLRLADALDDDNLQRVERARVEWTPEQLRIYAETRGGDREAFANTAQTFRAKADLFGEIFGIEPTLTEVLAL